MLERTRIPSREVRRKAVQHRPASARAARSVPRDAQASTPPTARRSDGPWKAVGMACVRRRLLKDGKTVVYLAMWRERAQGKELSKSFERKADAERHLIDMQHRLLTGTYVPPRWAQPMRRRPAAASRLTADLPDVDRSGRRAPRCNDRAVQGGHRHRRRSRLRQSEPAGPTVIGSTSSVARSRSTASGSRRRERSPRRRPRRAHASFRPIGGCSTTSPRTSNSTDSAPTECCSIATACRSTRPSSVTSCEPTRRSPATARSMWLDFLG